MLYRKSTLGILLVLIFLSSFGTLTLTASMFPQNYDWRYRVISNLLSPRDNPDWYWIAAVGLGLSGVLMLPFAGYLGHSLGRVAPRMAKVTAAAFVLGIITLICACVVFPQHTHATLGIQRLHEFLGHSFAGFFAFGMLCGCWCASKVRTQNSAAAWLFWSWLLLTAGPLIGLFCSETLLLLTKRGTFVGGTDPPHVAPFRLLAPGLLGMDRRNGYLSLSLRGSLFYSRASSRNGVLAHRGLTGSRRDPKQSNNL